MNKSECPAGRLCKADHSRDGGDYQLPHHTDGDGSPCNANESCFPDGWECGLGRAVVNDSEGYYRTGPGWHHCNADGEPPTPCHGALCPQKLRTEDVGERRAPGQDNTADYITCNWCGRPMTQNRSCGCAIEQVKMRVAVAVRTRRHQDLGPPRAQQRKAGEPERRAGRYYETFMVRLDQRENFQDRRQSINDTFGGTVRRPVAGSNLTEWQRDRRKAGEPERRQHGPVIDQFGIWWRGTHIDDRRIATQDRRQKGKLMEEAYILATKKLRIFRKAEQEHQVGEDAAQEILRLEGKEFDRHEALSEWYAGDGSGYPTAEQLDLPKELRALAEIVRVHSIYGHMQPVLLHSADHIEELTALVRATVKELKWIAEFSEGHHGDQEVGFLLHSLCVDIPSYLETLIDDARQLGIGEEE